MQSSELAEKLADTGTGESKLAIVRAAESAESAIEALEQAGCHPTAAKAKAILADAAPTQQVEPPVDEQAPQLASEPTPGQSETAETPLPEDFPHAATLIEAGITSVQRLQAVKNLTAIKGIGKAAEKQILDALKS